MRNVLEGLIECDSVDLEDFRCESVLCYHVLRVIVLGRDERLDGLPNSWSHEVVEVNNTLNIVGTFVGSLYEFRYHVYLNSLRIVPDKLRKTAIYPNEVPQLFWGQQFTIS